MKKQLITILLSVTIIIVHSQPSDFLVLKKNKKTIHSFYAGTAIEMITKEGVYKKALINRIANDTLFLQEFLVQQIPTTLGTYIIDTAGSFRYKYHYNQIKVINSVKKRGFGWQASGASLLGGGALLLVGSGVVYLTDRKKFSPELAMAAAGAMGLGYLLFKLCRQHIIIGKRGYSLHYINMTT